MIITKLIFWLSLFLLIYPYAIYPALLYILSRLFPYEINKSNNSDDLPNISFIISAFNEEDVIEEKIQNTLSIDYPEKKLEIIVVSDASDDETDQIVETWSKKDIRIKLVRQNDRKGKTAGINLAMKEVSGEIVVFSDANAIYRIDSLSKLVESFNSPKVGYVVGAALYNQEKTDSGQSEGIYWNYELILKKMESTFYSVVGGDGAIYAIRKELYFDLEEDDINDFVNPLQIVAAGYRGVFNSEAICYEDAAEGFDKEFRRKRRIVNRSWRAVTRNIHRFNIKEHKRFIFELVSHKVIRWFTMLFMATLTLSGFFLSISNTNIVYSFVFVSTVIFILTSITGYWLTNNRINTPKLIYIPYYFCLVNIAALLGIIDNIAGIKHVTWDHVRKNESQK